MIPRRFVPAALLTLLAFSQHVSAQPGAQYPSLPPNIVPHQPAPDFPLRVHIITVRWGSDAFHRYASLRGELNGGPGYYVPIDYFHGFGIANLQQDPVRGFEYNFDCPAAFTDNHQPDQSYPARWKTTDQSLEILTQPVASDHLAICELHVTMKPQPFDLTQRPMLSSASLGMNAFWHDPGIAFTGDAPGYPVRLHIITSLRRDYQNGTQGYGIANLEGPQPRGVDYTFNCNRGLLPNSLPGESYPAQWIKQDQRLEVLMQRVGSDKVDRCRIDVTIKAQPYSGSPPNSAAVPTPPASNTPVMTTP